MRALGWIRRAEAPVAATLLVAMVGLIFAGGLARTFGYPINWAIDVATCLFAWACFLCGDIAWRRNSLVSIELAVARLPARARAACAAFNYAVIIGFLLYVIGMGFWLSWISRARSFQGIPDISYSWVTLSLPVGGLLLLATAVEKVRTELLGRAPRPEPLPPG